MDVGASGDSGGSGGGEGAEGISETMDLSESGTAAATNVSCLTRKRRSTSIVSIEVPNIDIDPMAGTPGTSSVHTKRKARKE